MDQRSSPVVHSFHSDRIGLIVLHDDERCGHVDFCNKKSPVADLPCQDLHICGSVGSVVDMWVSVCNLFH